jgi:hypothetical protein
MHSDNRANTRDVPAQRGFVVTLADDGGEQPAIVRLRRALKYLGRAFNLRCTDISPINPPDNPASEWRR